MVKPSNKAKGKPSKRRTLKTKYKIERKVKQHRKNLKKEAKQMQGKGFRHKRASASEFLPNLFPFKQQILEDIRSKLPKQPQVTFARLDSTEFGLISLDNKSGYLPKSKDILLKKCITNLDKLLANCTVVLEVLEARNPQICVDEDFRQICRERGLKRIVVITKTDTIRQQRLEIYFKQLTLQGQTVCKFTTDGKFKKDCIEEILSSVKSEAGENAVIAVVGKTNTGKHTLINQLCRHASKVQDAACELFRVTLAPGISLIDAPYRLIDKTNYPLFHLPNPIEEGLQAQEEAILKELFISAAGERAVMSRNESLVHYGIQDFNSVQDLVKKIGKACRAFGKGGMVDGQKVRTKVLTDWYGGRINHLLSVS